MDSRGLKESLDKRGTSFPQLSESTTSQIEKDLDRTFPQQIKTVAESVRMYKETRALLQLFAVYRPDIGYVQGMNYLATTLMSIFPLYEAFICFANLVLGNGRDRTLLHSMYVFDVERIGAYNKIFNKLLEHYSPELYELLESHSINSQVYTLPWWYTLYSNSL